MRLGKLELRTKFEVAIERHRDQLTVSVTVLLIFGFGIDHDSVGLADITDGRYQQRKTVNSLTA